MSRWWAVRFHFGSAVLALAMASVCAAAPPPPIDDTQWLERSRRLLEESLEAGQPDWLRPPPDSAAIDAASEIAEQSMESNPSGAPLSKAGRVLIFASFSVPRGTLKNLLSQATDENVVMVLRGVPKGGASIHEAIRRIKSILPDQERVPKVILDPSMFRRYGVERVPTLVLERESGRSPVTVVGAMNVSWLRRMAANVQAGQENLGKRAEDYEIAEVDLIEEMQQRLARIDWAAQREAARENFWARRQDTFAVFPDAQARRETLIDPSVRVTEDLFDAEGNLLVSAGHAINPLDWMPLSKLIVVFRGTDSRHVSRASELARSASASGRGVILLTTDVDTKRGWEHLTELERVLSGPVYVLPRSLIDRFKLTRIPATVTSHGNRLLVTEIPIGEPR